ncbi:MAG: hypothetical protein WBG90_21240 [Saonia sp.]
MLNNIKKGFNKKTVILLAFAFFIRSFPVYGQNAQLERTVVDPFALTLYMDPIRTSLDFLGCGID